MKSGAATLAALLGVASARSVVAAAGPPVYDIPRLEGIVIDGRTDDWGDSGFRVDLLLPVGSDLKAAGDLDARARFAWDDQGLLVLMFVTDDRWLEHPDPEQLSRWDGITLFLTPFRGSPDTCKWVVSPGMDPAQTSVRWRFHDYRKTPALRAGSSDPAVARQARSDGCLVEVRLPWSAVGITPTVGQEAPFVVWVDDVDRPVEESSYHAAWYPAVGSSIDRRRIHTIRLADRPSPPVIARARADYDMSHTAPRIAVYAPAEQNGAEVSVVDATSAATIASGKLAPDGAGRARTTMLLPRPAAGAAHTDCIVRVSDVAVESVRFPHSDRLETIVSLRERASELRERFALDRLGEALAQASPLVRRHRGLVAERLARVMSTETLEPDEAFEDQMELANVLAALDSGRDWLAGQSNQFACACYSPASATSTPFVCILPKSYDPAGAYPLVVQLQSDLAPTPNRAVTSDKPYFQALLFARGESGYRSLADNDVSAVIDYMKQWYRIDPARIHVYGSPPKGAGP